MNLISVGMGVSASPQNPTEVQHDFHFIYLPSGCNNGVILTKAAELLKISR